MQSEDLNDLSCVIPYLSTALYSLQNTLYPPMTSCEVGKAGNVIIPISFIGQGIGEGKALVQDRPPSINGTADQNPVLQPREPDSVPFSLPPGPQEGHPFWYVSTGCHGSSFSSVLRILACSHSVWSRPMPCARTRRHCCCTTCMWTACPRRASGSSMSRA